MDITLWDDASRDFEEEQAIRRLHSAKARVAGTWSFLANAATVDEYAQRKDMAISALADAVWAVTSDGDEAEDTWTRLHASLDEDYAIVLEARKIAHPNSVGFHRWLSTDGDNEDQCIGCGVVTPDFADPSGPTSDHGPLPLDCPGPDVKKPHHFTHNGRGGIECHYCGHTVDDQTHPHDVNWNCGSGDQGGNDDNDAAGDGDSDGGGSPFEAARRAGSRRVAANDAEQAQYSAEVNGYNQSHESHPQHCTNCGVNFNGNANHINFTPGPNGEEHNHCPTCHSRYSVGEGHLPFFQSEDDWHEDQGRDYSADDQDPHYGDVHYREGSKTASETNQDECGICGTRLTGHKPAEQNENGSWGMDEHYDENGEAATGGPGNRNGGHWHRPANVRPPVTDPSVHTFDSTGEAYDDSQTNEHIKDGDVLSVPNEGVHGYLHHAWPVAVVHPGDPGAFHTFNDGEGNHEDKGRYEVSKAKAQEVAGGGHTATLNILAVVRILAGEDAGRYIIVDEESGYKIAGPFPSRSDAEAAIASGKFQGKNVKIEQAGEEESSEEDAHRGGKGSHDESGGSKPFDDKGHHRKRESTRGRLPFA